MSQRVARRSRLTGRRAAIAQVPTMIPVLAAALLVSGACGRSGEKAARDVLHAIDQGKITGTRGTMENVGKALTTYSMDRGGYPQGNGIQVMTAALVPAFLPSAAPVDAWGHSFVYRSDGRSYTFTSPGADGRAGDADDMVMTDGQFTHLPAPTR